MHSQEQVRAAVSRADRPRIKTELLRCAHNIVFSARELRHSLQNLFVSDMQRLRYLLHPTLHPAQVPRSTACTQPRRPLQFPLVGHLVMEAFYSCACWDVRVGREGECRRGMVCVEKGGPLLIEHGEESAGERSVE